MNGKSGTFPSQSNHYLSGLIVIGKQYTILRNVKYKRENVYQIKEHKSKNRELNPKPRVCIYCEKSVNKDSESESASSIEERRLTLAKKKLCFNCTGGQHRASECRSNRTCFSCKGKPQVAIPSHTW